MRGYTLAFIILLFRGWERLLEAELWAEDGATMLKDALDYGWRSVLFPTDATPQFLQRFASVFYIKYFSIERFPLYMALTAFCLNAAILGHFGRRNYRWYVSNDFSRWLTVAALCCVPGLTEMLANMANTNWFLFFGCCLILLKDPVKRLSKVETVFISLSLVSIGTGLLLIPLWARRVYLRRRAAHWPDFTVGAFLFLHLLLLRYFKSNTFFEIPKESLLVWAKTYWRSLVESFFIQPWAGDNVTVWLFSPEHRTIQFVIAGIFVLFFVRLVWHRRDETRMQNLLIFFFVVSLWPVLCWIGRPGSIVTFIRDTPSHWYFSHRYSFPIAFMAVIVWAVLLQKKLWLQIVFCCLFVLHTQGRWKIGPYGTTNRWDIAAPILSKALKTGSPKTVRIPVYPERLDFDFTVKN